jgi:formylglycine-generating enzyme required for sulfatase activity
MTCEQMAFCHVPAGKFIFGEGKEQKKINLPEYWIGKYPVTHAQFMQFVAARGYENKAYWQEAVQEKYWSKEGFKGRFDDAPRTAPVDFGEPFNLPNHPVVGISWYEALAFTRWLSGQLPVISEQWSVNRGEDTFRAQIQAGQLQTALPTEEQWEKAARGTDGRIYPWGQAADPNRANYDETGIGATSAVGCFPGGQSPYGLLDASGNVWEWVNGKNNLRGGAFTDLAGLARCACRGRSDPSVRLRDFGFRVVVVGFSRASQSVSLVSGLRQAR